MNQEQAKQLLKKYRSGECTEEETTAVEEWFTLLSEEQHWDWSQEDKESFRKKLKSDILKEIAADEMPGKQNNRFSFFKFFAAAAVIAIIFSAAFYYYNFNKPSINITTSQSIKSRYKNDRDPGTVGAILTLANGRKIILDSAGTGVLAVQGNANVINKNGQLVYLGDAMQPGEVLYNTIVTPKGHQYNVTLSDGTVVWLNAASSIRYPAILDATLRQVEITGEVYFEVAQLYKTTKAESAKIPFVVNIKKKPGDVSKVEVLGTHFNINAYDDEAVVKTTLLEGSVKFRKADKEVLLSPGNQSQLNKNGSISIVKNADLDATIAWKNGLFSFDNTDIKTAMKQLARWYDVDVEFENNRVPDEYFYADIRRSVNLSNILKAFEKSGVKFSIEGRVVTVLNN